MIKWTKLAKQSPRGLRSLQNRQLKFVIKHLVPYHPFYRKMFASIGKIASSVNLIDLPFSSKLDLLPTKTEPTKPRDFILQPNKELIRKYYPKGALLKLIAKKVAGIDLETEIIKEFKPIQIHFTTGRSTAQIPFFYTSQDLQTLTETGWRLFQTVGASTESIVVNAFPFAPHLAFWLAYYATNRGRLLSLQTGGGKILGTQKIIDAIERMKATMLISMPGYAYHLLREAKAQRKDFSHLKLVVLGGERVAQGLREKMKTMLKAMGAKNVKILATYAFTEAKTAWAQCHEKSGYHLYPDLEYIELVDEAGKPVPEGQPGEVVYTNLGWRGSMVIRYRTGDISQGLYYSTPCQYCGRTVPRLDPIIERKFDQVDLNLTKVKGELINLGSFSTIIHQMPEVQEWQVEIKKKNDDPHDLDELLIHLNLKPGAKEKAAVTKITDMIRREVGVAPTVRVRPLEELIQILGLEAELKEKRIVDRRKK